MNVTEITATGGADLMKAFKLKRIMGFDYQVTGSVRKRYAASWNNVVKL